MIRLTRILRITTVIILGTLFIFAGQSATFAQPAPKSPNQTAVLSVTQIPAQRAAEIVRRLFPSAHVSVDPNANAVLVVTSDADIAAIRSVLAGIDVHNPLAPAVAVVNLQHIERGEVVAALRGLYPAAHIDAGPNHSLIVRASPSDLVQVQSLIASLDVAPTPPPTPVDVTPPAAEVVRIAYAVPRDVARQVASALHHARVRIAGSNLLIVGTPDDVSRAKTLIAALDHPPADARYSEMYHLHVYEVTSVADLLQRSFPDVAFTVEKDVNALSALATDGEQRRIADAIAQLDTNPTPGANAGGPGASGGGSGEIEIYTLHAAIPGANGAPSTSASELATTVTQALSTIAPDLRITIVAASQQLILAGNQYSIKSARDLLERLDIVQPLVVLDTQVIEVDESIAKDLGLSLPQPVISSVFSETDAPVDANGNPKRVIGFQSIQRTPLSLPLQLNMLIQKGDARILSDPRITTISGRTATIRAGDTISVQTTAGGGAGTVATTQLQTFQTGVSLDITPIVNADGLITVTLHPTVNSETGILNGIPQIATRDTQTTVALRVDQTLIIGGLIQDSSSHSENKIPILGDLPLIGPLFREKQTNSSRNELIITVTPHIIDPMQESTFPTSPLLMRPPPFRTLPATTELPLPRSRRGQSIPSPTPLVPVPSPTDAAVSDATSPTPSATIAPAAPPNLNTFTYGTVPQNNFARPTDGVRIFYATFAPTVLTKDRTAILNVVTTTNVTQVHLQYGSSSKQLVMVGPGQWQGNIVLGLFSGTLPTPPSNLNLTLVAAKNDGTSASIPITASLIP
ncbi:MAG TPA: secretin N-terminal domain-containing protein [Candidatus Baltobacteraceae bacterium]|jgi:type II secretory pathway component GspD/PulD (secretin)|nr:secretin N-terminal domain-containing protein [Candidatus Baltobacteraceae bacterium]